MPTDDDAFLAQLHQLVRRLNERPDERPASLTPLGERVRDHLGVDPGSLPVVVEQVAPHRLIDLDLALDSLAGDDPTALVLGISGGQARHHEDLPSLIQSPYARFTVDAAVEYATVADGPRSTRQVAADTAANNNLLDFWLFFLVLGLLVAKRLTDLGTIAVDSNCLQS